MVVLMNFTTTFLKMTNCLGCEYLNKDYFCLKGRITSIAWYDPLNVIVTGGLDNIRVWSVNSGNPLQRIMIPRQQRNKETIVWAVDVLG